MVKNGIRIGVVLPGGWHFPQAVIGSGPFKIAAQTYEMLEEAVFKFRVEHLEVIPSGTATRENVQSDIYHYVCAHFPGNCATTGYSAAPSLPEPVIERRTEYNSPIVRVEDWLRSISNQEISFTDAATAQFRSEICATCPQNVKWQVRCIPCNDAIYRRVLRLKGSKTTTKDSMLDACRCYGHMNSLAIWMKSTLSVAKDEPPAHCWAINQPTN